MDDRIEKKVMNDPWRLNYHLMPKTGWLNDPNGAVQKDGIYHIYHQYVPENAKGGKTHWGHKSSKDLVHFQEEEIFMSPDQPFDKDGVYSGSAIVKDGLIHFFYTGNVKELEAEHIYYGRKQHVIHVVSDDGFNILKRELVIHHDDYPEGFTDHIRDPKVFEKNGQYYMILGARKENHQGAMLTYRSSNLENWEYIGNFIEGEEEEGYMFECPDFFEKKDKDVLILSPQGIQAKGFKYQGPYQATYLLGKVDWKEVKFKAESELIELDRGFDFYAPQSFQDEEGNQILWAWMGIANSSPEFINPTVKNGWQHALALPRILTVEDGKLKQRPHPAYKKIRQESEEGEVQLNGQPLNTLSGAIYELKIDFLEKTDDFSLELRQDTKIEFEKDILTLSHGYSGYGRRKRQVRLGQLKELRIFSDSSSIEIFINDGDYVMTTRIYPEGNANKIALSGKGSIHYQKWP
ncbi:MAG: sucrose-6-phosphate hydrolase, partial [Atopostipes suicloacalis]|nr:sucrose-6-phosphate hydrolase [Atopostipes suicloacalis]